LGLFGLICAFCLAHESLIRAVGSRGFSVMGVILAALVLVVAQAARASWIVGSDGIVVRRLGRARFVPFRELAAIVTEDSHRIRLVLTSGEEVVLLSGPRGDGRGRVTQDSKKLRDAACDAMSTAFSAFQKRGLRPLPSAAALVGRGGRTIDEWRGALRELTADAHYRATTAREEDLLDVLEDVHAPEDARAGAAMVLRRSEDAAVRERVRIATEATASPRLRVALEDEGTDALEHVATEADPTSAKAGDGRLG
jgi:hypothetical protein